MKKSILLASIFFVLVVGSFIYHKLSPAIPKHVIRAKNNSQEVFTYIKANPEGSFKSKTKVSIIKFRIIDGLIVVPIKIAGRKEFGIFDTGSSSVQCPDTVCRSAVDLRTFMRDYKPYYSAKPRTAEWKRQDNIEIGEYTLKNCPVITFPKHLEDLQAISLPILGNTAFADVVVNIDYRNNELTLSSIDQNVCHDSVRPQSMYDFEWDTSFTAGPGVPLIKVNLNSRQVNALVDTGAVGKSILITNGELLTQSNGKAYFSLSGIKYHENFGILQRHNSNMDMIYSGPHCQDSKSDFFKV